MSKEKQITEIAFILDGCCNNLPDSQCETYACSNNNQPMMEGGGE